MITIDDVFKDPDGFEITKPNNVVVPWRQFERYLNSFDEEYGKNHPDDGRWRLDGQHHLYITVNGTEQLYGTISQKR